ncbi:hypothetical protein EZV62_018390 [Acer yangbiense]|uniref:DUF4218 domain-containing protein n=1 Tax=Acer yangbiense TaxID=1000413 RepID=A0A5C7HJ77_9ROSI|nr:hypothetical protein EZV62_018390 [Acer yangbiense]
MLRHNLDIMHIEKNVCDNVLGTVFNNDGKSKDSLNARLDLQAIGIRNELHPVDIDGKIVLPATCYILTNDEKKNIFHLAWEAKVAGPVQYRWMYPVERYLCKLKGYVRNKARPEGSITEGYLADKCVKFCSRYLVGVETKFNKPERNYDGDQPSSSTLSIFSTMGRLFGKAKQKVLNLDLHNAVTLYVLLNCDELAFFTREHKDFVSNLGVRNVEQVHREEFSRWFKDRTSQLYKEGQIDKHMLSLGVVLFNCDWFDTAREGIGFKKDRYGNIFINTTRRLNTQEPFVLASQAIQVFYANGVKDSTWSAIVDIKPRNLYEMTMGEEDPYQEDEMHGEEGQTHKPSSKAQLRITQLNEKAPPSDPRTLASNNEAPPSNAEPEVVQGSSAETPNLESQVDASSSGGKKKGRGKAKGVTLGHGLEVKIYQGRIVTSQVVRQISILFFQCLTGPWITFTEYPEEEFEILFARFKEAQFAYTCTEEELKAAIHRTVQNGYSKWMFQLRDRIFKKHKSNGDCYVHCPDNLPPSVWREMVKKWMKQGWQDKSVRNKNNKDSVDIHHTIGSVPIAKYKSEEIEKTRKEPCLIECFKKFHVRKKSKVWTHDKAEELYKQMETKIKNAREERSEVNEWDIYREKVGEPSHGHILGLGVSIKAKDVYGSSSEGSYKRARVDKTEEPELKIKSMDEELQQLRGLVVAMMSNSNAQPPTTVNNSSNEDVERSDHAADEQLEEDVDNILEQPHPHTDTSRLKLNAFAYCSSSICHLPPVFVDQSSLVRLLLAESPLIVFNLFVSSFGPSISEDGVSDYQSSITIFSWRLIFETIDPSRTSPLYIRLWGPVKPLESLHPDASPRGYYASR